MTQYGLHKYYLLFFGQFFQTFLELPRQLRKYLISVNPCDIYNVKLCLSNVISQAWSLVWTYFIYKHQMLHRLASVSWLASLFMNSKIFISKFQIVINSNYYNYHYFHYYNYYYNNYYNNYYNHNRSKLSRCQFNSKFCKIYSKNDFFVKPTQLIKGAFFLYPIIYFWSYKLWKKLFPKAF